ncbi:MAG: HEAT repeat domain-containing protein [Planctomycetota bacterium]
MLRREDFEEPDRWLRCKTQHERADSLVLLQKELLQLAEKETSPSRKVLLWSRISEICSRKEYLRQLAKSSWKGAPTLLGYFSNAITPREMVEIFYEMAKGNDLIAVHTLHFFLKESTLEELVLGALIELNPRESRDLITKGLNAKSPTLRKQCIQILSTWGNQEAFVFLIEKLEDPEKEIRLQVMNLLMNFEEQKIVLPLILRLKDKEAEVRERAAFYLGALGDPQAIRPLSECKDMNRSVQEQIKASLLLLQNYRPFSRKKRYFD